MRLLSLSCVILLSLLILSFPLLHTPSFLVNAQTDHHSDSDIETVVEPEEDGHGERPDDAESDYEDFGEDEEDILKKAPGIETYMILTSHPEMEITAGDSAVALIGFYNGAKEDYFIHNIFSSLRHPQDLSHIIENFTVLSVDQLVPSAGRTAYDYEFTVGELYLPRSYGLMIEIRYKSAEDENEFGHAIYNNTVKLLEVVEVFDTETFFMYVFMVTGLIIFAFILHYAWTLTASGRKHQARAAKKAQQSSAQIVGQVEAEKRADVDFSWVSPAAAQSMGKKSPRSPKSKRNIK
ncbi:Translocon-associated protein subunit alpha-like [Oopsacas minuta]|uniref:Translocon-associated protein subunit alpha n=1 Tax=Oopsacas minuta TaxID=111878 RepID=A0AAV7K3Z7_9METZ|nr:Translocon-associated protein subunit alpha-like [Oopsacas minuta]